MFLLYPGYALPKIYRKVYYCVSAAIHSKVVRVRNRQERKNREPPKRCAPTAALHSQKNCKIGLFCCACVSVLGFSDSCVSSLASYQAQLALLKQV